MGLNYCSVLVIYLASVALVAAFAIKWLTKVSVTEARTTVFFSNTAAVAVQVMWTKVVL
jgi:hypothetical protein